MRRCPIRHLPRQQRAGVCPTRSLPGGRRPYPPTRLRDSLYPVPGTEVTIRTPLPPEPSGRGRIDSCAATRRGLRRPPLLRPVGSVWIRRECLRQAGADRGGEIRSASFDVGSVLSYRTPAPCVGRRIRARGVGDGLRRFQERLLGSACAANQFERCAGI